MNSENNESLKIKSMREILALNPRPRLKLKPEEITLAKKAFDDSKTEDQVKKGFKWKWNHKKLLNKAIKDKNQVGVLYLSPKKRLELLTAKIHSGNFLVINNSIFRYRPSRVFYMGKWPMVIVRYFDRECVGFDDYDELLVRDILSNNPGNRINLNDEVIIKAIIAARLSEKQSPVSGNKWIWILVGLGLIVGVFYFMASKK